MSCLFKHSSRLKSLLLALLPSFFLGESNLASSFYCRLTGIHWASLILLCSAVLSIQISSNPVHSMGELPLFPCFMGLVFAGLQGTAGVCTERILKQNMEMDINQQNVWIFLYGLVLYSNIAGELLLIS